MSNLIKILPFLFFFNGLHAQIEQISNLEIDRMIDSLKKLPMSEELFLVYKGLEERSVDINYKKGQANASVHLGNYLVETGQLAEAIAQYQKVTNLGEELKDTLLIAKGYMSLGIAYSEIDEFEKSLAHYSAGGAMAKVVGNEKFYFSSIGGQAIVYGKMKDHDKAIEYLLKCKAGMTKLKLSRRVQTANYNIATIHLDQDEPRKALSYIFEYLNAAKSDKDSFSLVYGYRIISQTYGKLKDHKRALVYLDSTLYLAEKLQVKKLLPEIYKGMAKAYEATGKPKQALKAFQQYDATRQNVTGDEAKDRIAALEVKFETAKKEKDLLLKEKELLLKEKEVAEVKRIAQTKQQTMWLAIAGLIVCLGIGLLYFLKIQTRVREKAVSEKLMQSELELKELKNKQLHTQLENKKSDLTNLALDISRKNEFSNQLIGHLENLKKTKTSEIKGQLKEVISLAVSNLQVSEDLALLQENVETVNQEFYKKLEERFGDLTPNDKYLAGLVRLNLSNKEVAVIRGISAGSAKTGRHRLRKKFNLTSDVDIVRFLQAI